MGSYGTASGGNLTTAAQMLAKGKWMTTADSDGAAPLERAGVPQVGEMLRLVWGGHAQVLAGEQGISQRIHWVTTLRGAPPIFEPSGGHEVILAPAATLDALRELGSGYALTKILPQLAEASAAALVVVSPTPWECPTDAQALADQLAFPVLSIETSRPVGEWEREIVHLIVDRQAQLQQRATQIYRQLVAVSLEGDGAAGIIAKAAQVTGHVVFFEDTAYAVHDLAPVETTLPDPPYSTVEDRRRLEAVVQSEPLSGAAPPVAELPPSRLGLARYAAPVVTQDQLRGYVSVCASPDDLSDLDGLVAGRVAAVLALELAKQDAVRAVARQERDVLFEALMREAEAPSPELLRRLQQIGFDPTAAVGAISVHPEQDGPAAKRPARDIAGRLDQLADLISRFLRQRHQPALVHVDQEQVVALVALRSPPGAGQDVADPALRTALDAVHTAATTEPSGPVSCGASEVHRALADLPAAVQEASQAVRLGRLVHGPGHHACLRDLGLYRLLYHARDTPELRAFCQETLGRLETYDRRSGAGLIATLEAYFTCRANLSETARRLNLHRNSLLYRLARIEKIGQLKLQDPEALLSLQVALKARSLLADQPGAAGSG